MDDSNDLISGIVNEARFGQGLAAGCRLLCSRYRITEEVAILVTATAVATAVGPSARVRDPLGGDFPVSLDVTFCAGAHSPAAAAIGDAFRSFREVVGQKAVWRENVGSRRLRADFLATLTALEGVEQQLRVSQPPPTPPASVPTPDQDEVLRRTKLERENRLASRDLLRAELSERRMDLSPFLIAEDPGWDTVLAVDRLAFDNCLTSISTSGAMWRELLASTPKRIGKIARLLQASRRGHSLTDGATIMLHPMVICLHVAEPALLNAIIGSAPLRAAGVLPGVIVEVPDVGEAFDAAAFVDATDEQRWSEFLSGLFAGRMQGYPRLYVLDARGFNLLEDLRRWCRRQAADHPGCADLTVDWPGLALKLALCLHLAVGKGDEEVLDLVTVGTAAELMKSVGAKELRLVECLVRQPTPAEIEAGQVDGMIAKLDALGGSSTTRELFRCYSGQNYAVLSPILQRAVEEGRVERDGKRLSLARRPGPGPELSTSMRQP